MQFHSVVLQRSYAFKQIFLSCYQVFFDALFTGLSGTWNFNTPSSLPDSLPSKGSPFPSVTVNSAEIHLPATVTFAVNVPITLREDVAP